MPFHIGPVYLGYVRVLKRTPPQLKLGYHIYSPRSRILPGKSVIGSAPPQTFENPPRKSLLVVAQSLSLTLQVIGLEAGICQETTNTCAGCPFVTLVPNCFACKMADWLVPPFGLIPCLSCLAFNLIK